MSGKSSASMRLYLILTTGLTPFILGVIVSAIVEDKSRWIIIAIGLLTSAIGSIITWLITRPLKQLYLACREINTNDNWSQVLPNNSSAEIQTISAALKTLTNRHQELGRAYQQSIQEMIASVQALAAGQQLPPLTTPTATTADQFRQLIVTFEQAANKLNMIRTRNAQMTKFIHSLPTGIIALDEKGMICYANSVAEKLLQQSQQKLLQKKFASLVIDPPFHDPWNRHTLTTSNITEWLKDRQANSEECIGVICTNQNQYSWLGIQRYSMPGPLVYCLLRDLNKEINSISSDRSVMREQTLRMAWSDLIQNLYAPIQGMIAATRLLTGDVKQGGNKDNMLSHINAMRQQGTVADAYLQIIQWLSRCRWAELPEPIVTEFAAVEPARRAANRLGPLYQVRQSSTIVTDRDAGYICGDDVWVEMAILGVLYHAAWSTKSTTVGITISRQSGINGHIEDIVIYEIFDAGPALNDIQQRDMQQPYGNIYHPSYFDTSADGFIQGLMLASELVKRLGGHIEWRSMPNGALSVRISIPTRQPYSWATTPVQEIVDAGPLEELVIGWKLGRL